MLQEGATPLPIEPVVSDDTDVKEATEEETKKKKEKKKHRRKKNRTRVDSEAEVDKPKEHVTVTDDL